jgi:phosphoribosyl 1,2-cyclic phosphodiesterase
VDPSSPAASLCILASGSAGNCSILHLPPVDGRPRILLIDAGLSPRRTRRQLADMGLSLEHVEGIVLTHLDHDHWHAGWIRAIPAGLPIYAHKRHALRGRRTGALPICCEGFETGFGFPCGTRIHAVLGSHDELGVASYRFEIPASAGRIATLGFATDIGRIRYDMVEHLRGVDVLAIESNYCPDLQAASARPWFLKRRITGGSGHLSNYEALEAVRLIGPRSHVVFLHLSRECNHPQLVAALHQGAPYCITVTCQITPTAWIPIRASRCEPSLIEPVMVQMPLFGSPAAASGSAGAA